MFNCGCAYECVFQGSSIGAGGTHLLFITEILVICSGGFVRSCWLLLFGVVSVFRSLPLAQVHT